MTAERGGFSPSLQLIVPVSEVEWLSKLKIKTIATRQRRSFAHSSG
jgi:hypothetical protein